jgi:hypothetical protein
MAIALAKTSIEVPMTFGALAPWVLQYNSKEQDRNGNTEYKTS